MLRSAGQFLSFNAGKSPDGVGDQKIKLDFDPDELGNAYLDRAAALDPGSKQTKNLESVRKMRALDAIQRDRRRAILAGRSVDDVDDAFLGQLSDSDRVEVLSELAMFAYYRGENVEYAKGDRATYEAAFARCKHFADQSLALVEKFKSDPRYGSTQLSAHITRGLIALREGDRRLAVSHMLAATDGLKDTDVLTSWDTQLHARLGNYLLSSGERESVAVFWDRLSKFQDGRGDSLAEASAAIRAGRMPIGYQYFVTPH
jgi:hypothetical protein